MITSRMLQNAHKFTYLIEAYPEKTIPEVIALFQLPPVDINCAIWAAVERGLISEMSQEDKHAKVLKRPKEWNFGEFEQELEAALTYAFQKLNAEEKDMEENYLSNWTIGYLPHDTLVAVKRLLEKGALHEYMIEDGDNEYIFYTLKENAEKHWGAKQFKTNPLTGEEQEPEAKTEAATEATEE